MMIQGEFVCMQLCVCSVVQCVGVWSAREGRGVK